MATKTQPPRKPARPVRIQVPVTPAELATAQHNAIAYAVRSGIKPTTSAAVRDLLLARSPVALAARPGRASAGHRVVCLELPIPLADFILGQSDPAATVKNAVSAMWPTLAEK